MCKKIICNMKGSRTIDIAEAHLKTIEQYSLLDNLLDSNGIVEDTTLERLQLNVRSLLERTNGDPNLVTLAQDVIFHENMKALGLHQLILLYIEWQEESEVISNR